MSSAEYREWQAFYALDPFGDQRADLRAAKTMATIIATASKPGTQVDPNDYMLFPDDAHDLPEDVGEAERQWMLKLNRASD